MKRNQGPFVGGAFGSGQSREEGSYHQTALKEKAFRGTIGQHQTSTSSVVKPSFNAKFKN